MNTSTAREDPQEVSEVKVVVKDFRDYFHCNLEVGKAALADVGTLAAGTDIIVVIHINIKDHLLLHRYESFFVAGVVAVRCDIVYCSNINLVWYSIH